MAKTIITKEMTLGEVVEKFGAEAAKVMFKYGLHCIGCHVATFETIEQGARAHGLDDKQIAKMVKDLNDAAGKQKV